MMGGENAIKPLNGKTSHILDMVAAGFSLRKASKAHGFTAAAFLHWVRKDKNLAKQYALARDIQADVHFDEVVEIADTEDNPHKARVRIDARKYTCAIQRPKKYSEKMNGININIIAHEQGLQNLLAKRKQKAIDVTPGKAIEGE